MHNTEVEIARLQERLNASEKAIEVARVSMDKRMDGMNEFRQALTDQAGKFVTRAELISAIVASVAVITLIQKFIK